ncbi:hypothetical protein VTH06DRAFT_1659 [Thermothelomyces fergusii]
MVAPADIPLAQLQGLKWEANYMFRSPRRRVGNQTHISRPVATEGLDRPQQAEKPLPRHAYNLRSNPKRSKKAVLAHETSDDASSTSILAQLPRLLDYEQGDVESLVAEALPEMAVLLDIAFRKVIGVRGATPGIKTIKSLAAPSLIDIAPAVWDMRYLQVTWDSILDVEFVS